MEARAMADENSWPSWPVSRPGLTPRELRQLEGERRISERLQRSRERGGGPRGRDRRLTREDIVTAAVAVANAEGVEAVSMRRLARDLRAGPMSLYWYVESKDELLDLMMERIEGEMHYPDPTGDWRSDLRVIAALTRMALLRHPWAIELMGTRPPSGPNDARNADHLFGVFFKVGTDAHLATRLVATFVTYLHGAVQNDVMESRGQREMDAAMSRMTEEEQAALHEEFVRRITDSTEYPNIARMAQAGIDPDDPTTRDERFEFGLDLVLDGIATRLPRGCG
jgi:AcrR family transcriptional regulator